MSRRELRQKVICITGASAGIGKATALACAREGMRVVVSARREDRLTELSDQINAAGGEAIPVVCDVASDEQVNTLVQRTLDHFGQLDAVLANAGYGLEQASATFNEHDWRQIFEVNFWGTMRVIGASAPILQAQGHGHILITSSCLSRFTLPYYSAYSATKASQTQVARSMRLELAPDGIDVSVVHPIATRTEFFDKTAKASGTEHVGVPQHAPKMFVQPPERVAKAIVKCLRKPVPEVWTSHLTRVGVSLMVLFPWFPDMLFKKEATRGRARLEQDD